MSNIPTTSIIHINNRVKTNRVCKISKTHANDRDSINKLLLNDSKSFESLLPGIYYVIINNIKYYFDLYIDISTEGVLYIVNEYKAYVISNDVKYPIILYRYLDSDINLSGIYGVTPKNGNIPSSSYQSTWVGSIRDLEEDNYILKGIYPYNNNYLVNLYAVRPKNNIIPSSSYQSTWVGTSNDLKEDNEIYRNIYPYDNSNKDNESIGIDHISSLNNTVNSSIDMILIDGQTSKHVFTTDLSEIYAVRPKNNIIPSSIYQSNWIGTVNSLKKDNDIIYGLSAQVNKIYIDEYGVTPKNGNLPSSSYQITSVSNVNKLSLNNEIIRNIYPYDKNRIENNDPQPIPNITDPIELRSISKLSISTSSDEIEYYNDYITLKNNIKSLPDGTKDTCILNIIQQQHHLIYRIGRKILTGNENWKLINYSNGYYLFWYYNTNIKLGNSNKNINCTHFRCVSCDTIIDTNTTTPCISTGSEDTGLFIKVASSLINPNNIIISFKLWLVNELKSYHPVIVEYPLVSPKYVSILIDNYDTVKAFYPNTFIKNNNYNISYFYKSFKL